jgi:hypothetical protein
MQTNSHVSPERATRLYTVNLNKTPLQSTSPFILAPTPPRLIGYSRCIQLLSLDLHPSTGLRNRQPVLRKLHSLHIRQALVNFHHFLLLSLKYGENSHSSTDGRSKQLSKRRTRHFKRKAIRWECVWFLLRIGIGIKVDNRLRELRFKTWNGRGWGHKNTHRDNKVITRAHYFSI